MAIQNNVQVNIQDNGTINVQYLTIDGSPTTLATVTVPTGSLSNTISQLGPNDISALQTAIQSQLNNNQYVNGNETIAQANAIASQYLNSNNTNQANQDLLNQQAIAVGMDPTNLTADQLLQRQNSTPYNPNTSKFNINNNVELQRQTTSAASNRLLDPTNGKQIGDSAHKNGTLQSTLSGSDLSVFFLTEIPKASDLISDTPSYLQGKELLLIELDSVMQLSYSIVREVFPVRSLGRSKPKGFTRGPIGIAGYLSFSIFTEDVLTRLRTQMSDSIKNFQLKTQQSLKNLQAQQNKNQSTTSNAQIDSLKKQIDYVQNNLTQAQALSDTYNNSTLFTDTTSITSQLVSANDNVVLLQKQLEDLQSQLIKAQSQQQSQQTNQQATSNKQSDQLSELIKTYNQYNQVLNSSGIYMLNQLLPFHLLVMGTNEQGVFSKMMIKNIRIIDENQMQGVQQPNIVNRVTFSAEDISPLSTGTSTTLTGTSNTDQGNISANKYSIYTGSQLMKSLITMADTDYSY